MNVRRLDDLAPDERAALVERDVGVEAVREDVRAIVERVREEGDAALRALALELDGVEVDRLDVTDDAATAYERIDDELSAAIEAAAANLRAFHERQLPEDWRDAFDGRLLGRRFRPLQRVGAYVPGGTAAYPSSALMTVVPAKVAGVDHVAVATPPTEERASATLAAIHAAGADRVYAAGGAQAIAALAYGTETMDAAEKVVGPGNQWVTAAKAEVRGDVEIDFLAGPSEILVVADATADPRLVAADAVAQAEHDPGAAAMVVTDHAGFAEAVAEEIDLQAGEHAREEIIRAALANPFSGVVLASSMADAASFAEEYAPEHLSIQTDDDETVLDRIDSAGSVFLGPYTPVAAGDYASGTNHVLPTDRGARVTGGLSVETFMRSSTIQRLNRGALAELRKTITTLARAEGLDAHAASVERRFDDED